MMIMKRRVKQLWSTVPPMQMNIFSWGPHRIPDVQKSYLVSPLWGYTILQKRRPQVLLKIKIHNSVFLLDANGTSWMDSVTVFVRKRQFITVLIRKFVNGGH